MAFKDSILGDFLYDDKADGFSMSRLVMFIGISLNALVVLWFLTMVTILTIKAGWVFPSDIPNLSWMFGATGVGTATSVGGYAMNQWSRRDSPSIDAETEEEIEEQGENAIEVTDPASLDDGGEGSDEEPTV